ncbi:MAG: bifunctional aspartate transaminase/aspartate 4-decarboxylase [Deltaproteobacteria bacterium]|nr:bifunctional aspartate transaminase/aspartate 4-decarboxylase [Deltaproteobacteria bacterium]
MDTIDIDKLGSLSPFELQAYLISAASGKGKQLMLNAGRGNPNFLATLPRHGFFLLGKFALDEAERSFSYMPEGVGGMPEREGIEERFEIFVYHNRQKRGVRFLRNCVSYVRDHLGLSAGDFIHEMTQGILGCMYPMPDRMLTLSEKIVAAYIRREIVGDAQSFCGTFDMFAVEGGTAAISYLFATLKENRLLVPGDAIGIGMPIFTPYLEIPELADFQLREVAVNATPENNWQYCPQELDKLLDPAVKAFFLVNPSNPPSVKISDEGLKQIASIVAKRPDLLILTDDVYGTFADDFRSLFAICPENSILVYSFSKYFGATGWRLGVIATHENCVMDKMIAKLPEKTLKELDTRYASITTDPRHLKFIDRLVADSRTVALNHTAGLSTPAQVQMVLFSLFSLMDEEQTYKRAMKRIIRRRRAALYADLPVAPPTDANDVEYYHLMDMEVIGRQMYEPEFIAWLLKRLKPNEFLFALAEKANVVLLPSSGFGGPAHPSARVSLANLKEVDYIRIGKAFRCLLDGYHEEWKTHKPV